jgi:ABC-type molybdate transport system substrate-binding protein
MKRKFALNTVAATLALAASSTAGWAQTIQDGCTDSQGIWNVDVCIGAVPTIKNALEGDNSITPRVPGLIEQYPAFSGLVIGVHYDPSGKLLNQIKAKLSAGEDSPYDLFLAADTAGPTSLAAGYAQAATPLNYAEGVIMLWSNGNPYSIDVTISPEEFKEDYTTTAICDPSMGPYGEVAKQVLQNVYQIAYPNDQIKTYPMITAVDTATSAGGGTTNGAQSGWVPTALHCQWGSVVMPENASHRIFYDYSALQAGTAIASSRGQQSTAQYFLNWIANTASGAGQEVLEDFCLQITP